jgi:hypothetical protein
MGQPVTKDSFENSESKDDDDGDSDDEAYEFVELLSEKNSGEIKEQQTNVVEENFPHQLSTEKYFIRTTTTSTTSKSTYNVINPIEVEKVIVAESESELQQGAQVGELTDEQIIFVRKNKEEENAFSAVEGNEESDGSLEDYVLIEEVVAETLDTTVENNTVIHAKDNDTISSAMMSSVPSELEKPVDDVIVEERNNNINKSFTKSLDEGYSSPKSLKPYAVQFQETEIEFEPLVGTTKIVDDTTQQKGM